ncbi:MAG: diadenylate cyclase CdaA, partial [Clostridia bacterium]|nr:diadenylate cyclase CdaA [Clostridia bacterium]
MLLNIFTDSELVSRVVEFFEKVKSLRIGVVDILDIALVAFVLYHVLKLVRGSKAIQLLKGIILLIIAYGIVYFLNMETSVYIFRYFFTNIFIILIVVFQQEIRQMIEHLGRSNVKSLRSIFGNSIADDRQTLNNSVVEICKAVQRMSDSKTGALIVFERAMLPKEVTDTGVELDAEITHELIGNVFFPNSPLHDGAALIRDSRLYKAGCVLPNTRKDDVSSDLGTRHRAAIGMSEESDAVVVVVSEETGQISSAYK